MCVEKDGSGAGAAAGYEWQAMGVYDDEDLDDAPGQTTLRDESNEEGSGRSEGPAARRLGQTGEYAADDDELQYGRNLTGRNRIPGAGSKRNR